jgi:hypothetical protein
MNTKLLHDIIKSESNCMGISTELKGVDVCHWNYELRNMEEAPERCFMLSGNFTTARPQEVFAACLAHAAVLVVFISGSLDSNEACVTTSSNSTSP